MRWTKVDIAQVFGRLKTENYVGYARNYAGLTHF